MFSQVASRLQAETNPLYALLAGLKSRAIPVTDLISGNVTEHGIRFPEAALQEILSAAAAQHEAYRPDSMGQWAARTAISQYYAEQGVAIPPENLLLTPGTSLSYWYCFKLLADETEEILCPRPSYPLFDYIAALSGVRLIHYRLNERRRWAIDLEHLEASISTKTRALVLISPHNPTGHVSDAGEIAALTDIAARHELALISDEVFGEFLLSDALLPRPCGEKAPLIILLNGFSKMFALPGLKLGWMGVMGDPEKVKIALRTLELISDTFLPVNEVVQAAVPEIFARGRGFLAGYRAQVRERWEIAREELSVLRKWSFAPPAGGFYLIVRLNRGNEERIAEALLERERLLVHPGYFYDLEPDHLVLSFIHAPDVLREALPRLRNGESFDS